MAFEVEACTVECFIVIVEYFAA